MAFNDNRPVPDEGQAVPDPGVPQWRGTLHAPGEGGHILRWEKDMNVGRHYFIFRGHGLFLCSRDHTGFGASPQTGQGAPDHPLPDYHFLDHPDLEELFQDSALILKRMLLF